jgi:hypothetical protein
MKKLQLVLISLGFAISASSFAQVAIGTPPVKKEPSAILHLESDQKGFLLPRMENKERLDILKPAEGLQVYVTDFEEDIKNEKKGKGVIMFYNGTKWKALTKLITCPSAPTGVQASYDTSSSTATITFTPLSESDNGGSPITSYTATAYSENHSLSTSLNLDESGNVIADDTDKGSLDSLEGSIKVTDLNDNTFYTFTVTATNAIDTSLPSNPSNVIPAPEVGDNLYGGVVFYLLNKDDGDVGYVNGETRGLICALEDLGGSYKWSPDGAQEVTGTQENMGHGKTNTKKIIDKLEEDNTDYAAYQATLYGVGDGYTGWYLPSIHELNKMYDERVTINPKLELIGGIKPSDDSNDYYWSSSEKGTQAWRYNFSNGSQTAGEKSNTYLVRPVRSF